MYYGKAEERIAILKVAEVAPCNLVEFGRRFRGVYCLHYRGD
jgi:hypothetical protein